MRTLIPLASALALVFASAGFSPVAGFQEADNLLDMDTFLEMESAGSPRISPAGDYILFTRTSVDKRG